MSLEEQHLLRLWPTPVPGHPAKARRSTTLVTTLATHGLGWVYPLSAAFFAALDIRRTPRVVNHVQRLIWTQGPMVAFDAGDVVHRGDGAELVQVIQALPMRWLEDDATGGLMDPGWVRCVRYFGVPPDVRQGPAYVVTQTAFVAILATGDFPAPAM